MERTKIADVRPGAVKAAGFVERIRNTGAGGAVLRDRSGKLQVTIEKAAHPDWTETLAVLTPESVVTVEGVATENPQVAGRNRPCRSG